MTGINPVSAEVRASFQRAASEKETARREGLPDPAKVAGSGIKTRESLDWLEAEHPKTPQPERSIDDGALRIEAAERSSQDHRDAVERQRDHWRGRARKGREDFGTAHNWAGSEWER